MFSINSLKQVKKRRPVFTRTKTKLADKGAELRHACGFADGLTIIYNMHGYEIGIVWYVHGLAHRIGGPAIINLKGVFWYPS
jgi:hypothetical protein